MTGRTSQEKLVYWLFADRIPVIKLLIAANILTFLAIALFRVGQITNYMGFISSQALAMPWTAFTYPLVGIGGPISLLFAGYWLWVAGGSLERSWGTATFATYFFLMSAISALGLYIGGYLAGIQTSVAGLWLPLAGVTIAFAMLNPEQQILFFFIIPLKLKYLALIDVILVLVSYGQVHIILGVFALAGCAASYWYVTRGRQIRFAVTQREAERKIIRVRTRQRSRWSPNPLKWYRSYVERKRLKDFLDRSGFED